MTRSTHTYAALEVTAAAYDEIAGKLRAAGYDHAFDHDTGAIDMHGIGLVREAEAPPENQPWRRDNEATFCLLYLCGGHEVPMEAIVGWTDEQCQQAETWAGREHLAASDNDDVERVPMPEHVKAHPPKPRALTGTVDDLWT